MKRALATGEGGEHLFFLIGKPPVEKNNNTNYKICYVITDFIFVVFIKQSLKGVNGVQFSQRMAIKPTRVGNCTAVSKRKPGSSSFSLSSNTFSTKCILSSHPQHFRT